MKRIVSKNEIKRRNTRNQTIMGIVLIFLMASSIVGFAFFSNSDETGRKIKYNEQEFQLNNGLWYTTINRNVFITSHNPYETEEIIANVDFDLEQIYRKPLYYVGENDRAISELIHNLGRYAERYQEVCLEGRECPGNFVVKNCSSNIIVLGESNYIDIYEDENCLFINAPYDKQVLASNRIIFKVLEIQ